MAEKINPEDRDAVQKALTSAKKSSTRRAGMSRTRGDDVKKAITKVEKDK